MKESLSDYVRRVRNAKGLSTTDVQKQSRGGISDAYVSRIENGEVKNVSPEKLTALAKGLDVQQEEIFRVARGLLPGTASRFDIYAERFDAQELSAKEWEFIEQFFEQTVESFKVTKAQQEQFGDMIAAKLGPGGELDQMGHEGLGIPKITSPKAEVRKLYNDQGEVEKPKRKAG